MDKYDQLIKMMSTLSVIYVHIWCMIYSFSNLKIHPWIVFQTVDQEDNVSGSTLSLNEAGVQECPGNVSFSGGPWWVWYVEGEWSKAGFNPVGDE